jgi:hypothetical protein
LGNDLFRVESVPVGYLSLWELVGKRIVLTFADVGYQRRNSHLQLVLIFLALLFWVSICAAIGDFIFELKHCLQICFPDEEGQPFVLLFGCVGCFSRAYQGIYFIGLQWRKFLNIMGSCLIYFLLSNACELALSGAVEQWTGVPAQCIRACQDHVMIESAFVELTAIKWSVPQTKRFFILWWFCTKRQSRRRLCEHGCWSRGAILSSLRECFYNCIWVATDALGEDFICLWTNSTANVSIFFSAGSFGSNGG